MTIRRGSINGEGSFSNRLFHQEKVSILFFDFNNIKINK